MDARQADDDDAAAAGAVIAALGLQPHPEGGWFCETWRAAAPDGSRAAGSAIYFLLGVGERSRWHRVDAAEVWHFYAGGPLLLHVEAPGETVSSHVLGTGLAAGHRPQHVVPAGAWQAAQPVGAWTLVACTVSPAFEFDGFELAPPGWEPGGPGGHDAGRAAPGRG
ncbi:MAG: cupin domain-containing protein [Acidimicrobiales bacterium]